MSTRRRDDGLSLLRQERSDPLLDLFLRRRDVLPRLYNYWAERGLTCTVLSRVLNLLTLAFTAVFSGFLLLYVNWNALTTQCRSHARECDIAQVGIRAHPLANVSSVRAVCVITYLVVLGFAFLWLAISFVAEISALLEMRQLCAIKLGLGDDDLRYVPWPEVVSRLIAAQTHARLSVVRDLTPHDVASRILRRENYLIGALNQGVLTLTLPWLPMPCLLTKCVEWSLYWAVLDHLFDDQCRLRADALDARVLARRCRRLAVVQLLLSPFFCMFVFLHFFMRNAERVYHHPSQAGARRWSGEARWRMRHYNEFQHTLEARLAAAQPHAAAYCACFPNHLVSLCARFVSFVVGAFAAALLALAAVDERLLEAVLWQRNLIWYTAICGTILAASRALVADEEPGSARPDPAASLAATVAHTHYLPRRWRNAGHSRVVYAQFSSLFPSAAGALIEEVASLFLAPAILWWALPECAPRLTSFLREFTIHVDGVGDVCSLAQFDLERHGNSAYGAPRDARDKRMRSRQGAVEKSFLAFQAQHPDWEPDAGGRALLAALAAHQGRQSAVWASAAAAAAAAAGHQAAGAHKSPLEVDTQSQALLQSLYEERRHRAHASDAEAAPGST